MRTGERVDVLVAASAAGPQYRTGTVVAVFPPRITHDVERCTVQLDGQRSALWGVRADSMRTVVTELGRA